MRKKAMLLMTVLLALAWYQTIHARISAPAEFRRHMESAAAYEEKELYEAALTECEAALEIDAKAADAKLQKARLERLLGDRRSFIADCEEMILAETVNEDALQMLVDYYEQNGRRDDIVALLEELQESDAESALAEELWASYRGSYEEIFYHYEEIAPFRGGYAAAKTDKGWTLIGATGQKALQGSYESVGSYDDGSGCVPVCADGQWYYIDMDGHKQMVPDGTCDFCGSVSGDTVILGRDGMYAYADLDMELQTDFSWSAAGNFRNGVAAVEQDGKWALLKKDFTLMTEYVYDDIAMDDLGCCAAEERIFAKDGRGYHLLDTSGAEVTDEVFENAKPFGGEGLAPVCRDGKWGYADAEGDIVIDCRFEDAGAFANGCAPVCRDGKWGYIDRSGSFVIEPEFVEARPFSADGVAPVRGEEDWFLIQLYAER